MLADIATAVRLAREEIATLPPERPGPKGLERTRRRSGDVLGLLTCEWQTSGEIAGRVGMSRRAALSALWRLRTHAAVESSRRYGWRLRRTA